MPFFLTEIIWRFKKWRDGSFCARYINLFAHKEAFLNKMVGFYSEAQLLDRLPYSRTTLWRQCKRGNFPKPFQISPGRVGWEKESADAAIAALAGLTGAPVDAEASDAEAT